MAQKKPYKDNRKNRNIPYTSNRKNSRTTKNEELSKTKKLENTVRIRIDEGRLNDSNSLDTSFLGGRMREKALVDKKVKEKILQEKKTSKFNPTLFKNIFFLLGIICLLIVSIMIVLNYKELGKTHIDNDKTTEITDESSDEKVIDDNYLFIGNFYVDEINFKELDFYKPFVKTVDSHMSTDILLDNMKEDIYIYNPSHIFLQVGLEELEDEVDISDIISNYRTIIDNIKNNRPYAKIFVESLFPINSEHEDFDSFFKNVSNEKIKEFNSELNRLADSMEIDYIDLYSELEEDNKIKDEYTNDGVHLNSDGYKKIWKVIRKLVS